MKKINVTNEIIFLTEINNTEADPFDYIMFLIEMTAAGEPDDNFIPFLERIIASLKLRIEAETR